MKDTDTRRDAVRGCIFGGAVGDALGYAVEFLSEERIFAKYGRTGITAYDIAPLSKKALISDDTQMTLFPANGLLVADTRGALHGPRALPRVCVAEAYQDWLKTQESSMREVCRHERCTKEGGSSWLLDVPELYARRAPGNTCLSALWDGSAQEDYIEKRRNNSKGCGGIMRVAPLGADDPFGEIEALDREAAQLAAITHGHSLGYMPAAVLVHVINRILFPPAGRPMALKEIVLDARDTVSRLFAGDPYLPALVGIIDRAVLLSENGGDDLANIHRLGEGWVAEETLGIALYCALKYRSDFSAGVIAAVNHKGDSDSTGAVTGNILGALLGCEAIPARWKRDLELADVILEIADDLDRASRMRGQGGKADPAWIEKYVRMRRPV